MATRRQLILGASSAILLPSVGPSIVTGEDDAPRITIHLLDPKTRQPLDVKSKVTVRVRDQVVNEFSFDGGGFWIANTYDYPVELQIFSNAGHVVRLERIAWRENMLATLVVWPPGGPETLDRIFEQLLEYEALYFQYALSSNQEDRARWEGIRQWCVPLLLQMMRPENVDMTLQENADDTGARREFVSMKLHDVWQMFQIVNGNAIQGQPRGHCTCHRRRCCWCGNPK